MKNQHKHLLARLLVGAFLILGIGFWTTKFVVVDAANRNVGGTLAWNNQTQFLNSGFWSHSPTTGDIIKALYGSGGEASIYTQNWSGYDYNTCLSGGMNVVYTGEIPTIVADNTIYVIDSGTYTVSSSIEMANCSALISSGTVTLSDGVGLDQIIFIYNKSNVIIENMEMTNGSSGPGLYITQSTNFAVNKNKIYDNVYGGRIERSSYGQISNTEIYNINGSSIDGLQLVDANHIYANDIIIHDGDANGVYLDASDNNSLTNIQSYHNGNFGIDIAESNDNSFANVQLHDNDSVGIYISTSSGNSLHSISAYNNANAGIVLANSTGSTLSGAISHDNVAEGIYVSASNGNSLTNVQSYNNAENGILVENNSDYNSLTNIQAYSNTVDGIYMFNSSDNSLGNIFAYENANGVEIRNGVGNDLSSIVSTNNNNNGFTLNGSTSSTISNVTTSGNAQAGVFLVRSPDNTLTGIVTYDNTNYGIYLGVDSDNNIITGTQAYNNNYGIYITESHSGLLNHIKTYDNYMDGIYMLNASDNNSITNVQSYSNTGNGIYIDAGYYNSLTNIQSYNNVGNGIWLNNAANYNIINNAQTYNNFRGLSIWSSLRNTVNNVQVYNNNFGITIFGYAHQNTISNSTVYNNTYGLSVGDSSNIVLNKFLSYNNSYGAYLDNTTITYYGDNSIFANTTNLGGMSSTILATGSSMTYTGFGRTTGSLIQTGVFTRDSITNPINSSGNYMLDRTGTLTGMRSQRNNYLHTLTDTYSFGGNIPTQIQTVYYSGINLVTGGTFDATKFIGSDITRTTGAFVISGGATTTDTGITIILTGSSNPYYRLFGDAVTEKSGSFTTSLTTGLLLSGGHGTKSVFAQIRTNGNRATHYVDTIMFTGISQILSGVTTSGYLSASFWNSNPSAQDVINALYGTGDGGTIYTNHWSGYTSASCLDAGMNVVYTGGLPTTIADHTIYVIASGTYTVSSSIEMANCSALISSGTVTLSDGVGLDQIILVYSKNNVIIENMEMTNGSSGPGLYITQSTNFAVNENKIYDNVYGGRIERSSYGQISNTEIYNITGSSIDGLQLVDANHIYANDIIIHDTDANGIYLDASDNNSLTNMQSYNNIQYGINISASDSNMLSGIITSGDYYGIYLDQATNGSLINVQTYNNANDGIYLVDAPDNILDTIETYNNGNDGINLESSNNITGNNIRTYNNANDGIYFLFSSDTKFNNVLAYNNLVGVHADRSSYSLFSGLVTHDNNLRGVFVNSSLNNTLNNIESYNNNDGIALSASTGNTLSNIMSYNNADHGIYIDASDHNMFTNAQVYNNTNFGILLGFSTYNSFNNMQIYNSNINAGFYLEDASHNVINNVQIYNNPTGIAFATYSDNNIMNNIRSYNNDQNIFINLSTGELYYGAGKSLNDTNNNAFNDGIYTGYASDSVVAGLGWTTGEIIQTGDMSRTYVTNPINTSGHYMLSWTGSRMDMYLQQAGYLTTHTDKYSFGSNILRQIQPVYYNGTTLTAGGTFDGTKFIGSSVAKINGSLMINDGASTNATGISVTLLGSSSPYYRLFGNVVAGKSGSLTTSTTTGLILTTGDGVKNVFAQIRTNNIWATHYIDTIILDTVVPTFTATLANGNTVVTGGQYNTTGVIITFTDTSLSGATLNNANYVSGTWITGDATYTFIVRDLAGNSTGVSFTIDVTNPILTGTSPASGATVISSNTIPFTWTTTETNISGYQLFVTFNGNIYATGVTTGAATASLFIPNNTGYARYVIATDKAGNTGTFVSLIPFGVNVPLSGIVALSGPTLITLGSAKWTKDVFPVYLRPNKACKYSITGDNIISQTGVYNGSLSTTINVIATGSDGIRTIYVYLYTGNESSFTTLIGYIDMTAPTSPTLSSPASGTVIAASTATLSWAAATDGAGIGLSGYRWYISDTDAFSSILLSGFVISPTVSATPSLALLPTLTGTYYWKVKSMDKLGRSGESTTRAFYYSGADYTPNSFSFDAVTNATLNRTYLSSTESVTGMSAGVYSLARVTKGILYIDGYPVGTTGLVTNGDTVNIELISSDVYDDVIYSTLTIGGFSTSSFRITTKVDPGTSDNSLDNGISSNLSTTQELQIVSIFLSLRDMYSDDSLRTTFFTTLMNSLQNQIDSLDATDDADKIDALQYLYDVIDNYLGGTNGTNDTTVSVFVGNNNRYVAPNGRVYQITHNNNTYTSPDFMFKKTFTALEAMKAYIDANNGGSYGGTSVGSWNTATVDQTWQSAPYVAPNGKSYRLFKTTDGRYSSYNFVSAKYFVSVESMKSYITKQNR
ncbi:MAG: right-handed parallel beta-helix repeat-containing protein [candidate division SR1 bacterium]|nr:right-handed parallel beta-helix repeat-containing protein [candidate division SR1 bacterium]